jgi:hypothetical protein
MPVRCPFLDRLEDRLICMLLLSVIQFNYNCPTSYVSQFLSRGMFLNIYAIQISMIFYLIKKFEERLGLGLSSSELVFDLEINKFLREKCDYAIYKRFHPSRVK